MSSPVGPAVVVLHNVDPSWPPADVTEVMDTVRRFMTALTVEGHKVREVPITGKGLAAALASCDPAEHIVFNWCEEIPGIPHSEVQVAAHLEQLGYTYTGSTPEVLSLAWDKGAVKAMLAAHGIPTPFGWVVGTDNLKEWHRFPAIVKPAFEHCSMGVDRNAVVFDQEALRDRVCYVKAKFSQPSLVEDFIDGREFHVTLWGNGPVHMLPPAEMDFSAFPDVRDHLCTFDSKFTPGSRDYESIESRIPAALAAGQMEALRRTSIETYRCIGCRDYARIDLRLRDDLFYVLDVNPNPDFSPDTSLAYAAEAAGMSYGAFAGLLVGLASERHNNKISMLQRTVS